MNKETQIRLLEGLPSWTEIYNTFSKIEEERNVKLFTPMDKVALEMIKKKKGADYEMWISFATSLDYMFEEMRGVQLVKTYMGMEESELEGVPEEHSSMTMWDCSNREFKVTGLEGLIIIKMMLVSNFEIVIEDDVHDLYLDFRGSKTEIYRILD